ncbi:MAG TPA: hypothetical protein ENN58_04405 [bacterium]|nr:hypothetical protein [bacterium]
MKKILFFSMLLLLLGACSDGKGTGDIDTVSDNDTDQIFTDKDTNEVTDENGENNDIESETDPDNENVTEPDEVNDDLFTDNNDFEFDDIDETDDNGTDEDHFIDEDEVFEDDDEAQDDDAEYDHVEVINNTDGSVTVNVTLNSEKDAVVSYLMDAGSSSWNYFYGDSINIGFRPYNILEDQFVAYHTAFRFTDVEVPPGATIEDANISFHPTNEVDSSKKVYLRIAMEKSINSEPFDTSNYISDRPDQRAKTDSVVEEWLLRCIDIDDCYDPESLWCKQRELDCWNREVRYTVPKPLNEMVKEVIDMEGWNMKNSMTLFITGTYPSGMPSGDKPNYSNSRSVTGYDPEKGHEYYPVLSITFTVK